MDNQRQVHTKIIQIIQKKPYWSYTKVAREVHVTRQCVSRVVKKFNKDLKIERKPGTGKAKLVTNDAKAKKVEKLLLALPNISGREVARRVQCSESFVRRVKAKAGLKTFKVQKVPDRNAKKNIEAKKRAKLLKKEFFQKFECCVMDDETYVFADFAQLPGQEFYVADSRGNVSEEFRTKKLSKFPKKFLVWQAICSCGNRSASFVTLGSINSDIYIKECLQKRLLPFLRQHNISTFFWPDLATCHYSKSTIDWYNKNNVIFVPKEANPPNCPELRPIERYWALVKRQLKKSTSVPKTITSFRYKWTAGTKKITENTITLLMDGIMNKIKNFIKLN